MDFQTSFHFNSCSVVVKNGASAEVQQVTVVGGCRNNKREWWATSAILWFKVLVSVRSVICAPSSDVKYHSCSSKWHSLSPRWRFFSLVVVSSTALRHATGGSILWGWSGTSSKEGVWLYLQIFHPFTFSRFWRNSSNTLHMHQWQCEICLWEYSRLAIRSSCLILGIDTIS